MDSVHKNKWKFYNEIVKEMMLIWTEIEPNLKKKGLKGMKIILETEKCYYIIWVLIVYFNMGISLFLKLYQTAQTQFVFKADHQNFIF